MQFTTSPVIVLMTDFGMTDTFIGQMKGVILSIAPDARIIDLTHAIAPQHLVQAAFMLGKSVPFLPEGSIVVSVVDPGVGTSRNVIALQTDKHTFLAPDNGLLTPLLQSATIQHCMTITNERYMLATRSSTFHGRDIFSPVAAHLAAGVPLHELGNPIEPSTCARIAMPCSTTSDNGQSWEGSVIYTDHFGNLVTSLQADLLDRSAAWMVSAAGCQPLPLSATYGDVADQQPLAYAGSSGTIEIAVRNGNAAQALGLQDGDMVRVRREC